MWALFLSPLVALSSCTHFPHFPGFGAERWSLDPGGDALTVPQKNRSPERLLTQRRGLDLQVGTPALLGARVEARRGPRDPWKSLPVDAATGLSHLDAREEGRYELRPVMQGASAKRSATLLLQVDRSGPTVAADVERVTPPGAQWQSALTVKWNAQDATAIRDVTVEFSDDAGATWRLLNGAAPSRGSYRWSLPPGSLRQQQIRIIAFDSLGNRGTRVFPLDPELLAQQNARVEQNAKLTHDTNSPGTVAIAATSYGDRNHGDTTAAVAAPNSAGGPMSLEEIEFGSPLDDPWDPWVEFGVWGTRVKGGARVRLPGSAGGADLESAAGEKTALALERHEGKLWARLPQESGGPYVLRLSGSPSSPEFWIDSDPPRVALLGVVGNLGEIEIAWSADDEGPLADDSLEVTLHLDDGTGWQERSLLGDGRAQVPVGEGEYQVYLSCRDSAGNEARTAGTQMVQVAQGGPRTLNFVDEVFRGGSSHFIFVDRGGPEGFSGPIEIRAIAAAAEGEPPIAVGVLPDVKRKFLWELPRRSGEYWLELAWSDDAGDHLQRGTGTFTIDAAAPALAWESAAEAVSFEMILSWARENRDDIESLELFRRSDASLPWESVALAAHSWTTSELRVSLRVSTDSWPEGTWQLGVQASDPFGNRTLEPLAGPVVLVDQQAPRVTQLTLADAVAGAPLQLHARIDETPAVSTLRFTDEQGVVLHRSVEWVQHDDGWRGTTLALPSGSGEVQVAFEDALGNRVEEELSVEVARGVVKCNVSPTQLFTGGSFTVSYELLPPHPLPESSLEVQLLPASPAGSEVAPDVAAEDVTPLERFVVSRRRGTVALKAPAVAGRYRVRFVGAELLGPDVTFDVQERSAPRVRAVDRGGDRHVGERRVGESGSSNGELGTPVPALAMVATETLIVDFRNFEWGWRNKQNRPTLAGQHGVLMTQLLKALQRNPDEVVLRQAAARMELFQEAPNVDSAKERLQVGIRRLRSVERPNARQTAQLADLLNDLAAVELRLEEWDAAENHLLNALLLEESSTRRYNLGQVYYSTRKFDDARRAFLRAIELDPFHVAAQRAWIATVRALGSTATAPAQRQLDEWRRSRHFDANQVRALSQLLTGSK